MLFQPGFPPPSRFPGRYPLSFSLSFTVYSQGFSETTTLVFPFESPLTNQELYAHATEAASTVGGFEITLGQPQIQEDHLWLPVVQGSDEVTALHEILYRGVLSVHLDTNRPYEPHLTVTRRYRRDFQLVYRAASTLRGPFRGYADRFFIESIMQDKSSLIEHVIGLSKM